MNIILPPKKNSLSDAMKKMKKNSVIFCGIARDNAGDLPAVIKSVKKTGAYFKKYAVIIYENDSVDNTKEILQKWQNSDSNVKIISESHYNKKRPNLKFLAYCRNCYLHAMDKEEYNDYSYVIMVDMDMKYGWKSRGIIDSFRYENWDVMCSNGIFTTNGRMWDSFAFRNEIFNFPYDPKKYSNASDYRDILVDPKIQKIYKKNSGLVPVYSAFGGLVIYRKSMLKDAWYDEHSDDCEHVSLHNQIRNKGGKIFMNPNQIIKYSHIDQSYLLCKIKNKIKALFLKYLNTEK